MPSNMQESLIFHYNLKFYDSEGDSFEGVSLKRFVMQVSNLKKLFTKLQIKIFSTKNRNLFSY